MSERVSVVCVCAPHNRQTTAKNRLILCCWNSGDHISYRNEWRLRNKHILMIFECDENLYERTKHEQNNNRLKGYIVLWIRITEMQLNAQHTKSHHTQLNTSVQTAPLFQILSLSLSTLADFRIDCSVLFLYCVLKGEREACMLYYLEWIGCFSMMKEKMYVCIKTITANVDKMWFKWSPN